MHDFDFLVGRWHVQNLRLRERFAECVDWDEFDGHVWGELWIDGVMEIDCMEIPAFGITAATVRTFDLARQEWSLRWIVSNEGVDYPPLTGRFDGDIGHFYGDDIEGGEPVKVEFRWDKRDPDLIRWEQRMSRDGTDWELNWTMDFTRSFETTAKRPDPET